MPNSLAPAFSTPLPATPTRAASVSPTPITGTADPSTATPAAPVLPLVPVPLAAGTAHTCMVTAAGAIRCWGSNAYGQLGNGTTGRMSLPVETGDIPQGAVAVAAGKNHTCAISAAGVVYCWGANAHGQLGDGTMTDRSIPAPVMELPEKTVMLAAGDSFACALSDSGGVKCWGENAEGQVGDGSQLDRYFPLDVAGLSGGIVSIAAGQTHVCALGSSGGVQCWGRGYEGQLGDGLRRASSTPVAVTGLQTGVAAIAAGGTYSCAILISEQVECWGYLVLIPEEDIDTALPHPTRMITERPATIGMGAFYACVLTTSGSVECWGSNKYGQLGNGTKPDQLREPGPAAGLSEGVAYLAVGLVHACALLHSGEIHCWGSNESWQLGINSKTVAYSPVAVDLSALHYYYSGIEATAPPANYPLKFSSIWSLTNGYRDLTAPAVNTYAATATRGDIRGWDFYLCASDKSRLEVVLSVVQVSFLIDYLPVSEKAIRIFPGNYDSWACRGWRTLLSGWGNDRYELAIKYQFSTEVFDGENTFPAGEYWQIIFLKMGD